MKNENIDRLLEKYWEGETSLQEEDTLKKYFSGSDVASEHDQYSSFFQLLRNEKLTKKEVDLSSINSSTMASISTKYPIFKKIAIAASFTIGIVITSVLYQQKTMAPLTNYYTDVELEAAYMHTTEVLALLSNTLNKANTSIYELRIIDESKLKIEN